MAFKKLWICTQGCAKSHLEWCESALEPFMLPPLTASTVVVMWFHANVHDAQAPIGLSAASDSWDQLIDLAAYVWTSVFET